MFDVFNLDMMSLTYVLVLSANLALILLIANLTYERARDAWHSVSGRANSLQTSLTDLQSSAEAAGRQSVEADQNIDAALKKLAAMEDELEQLKKRHEEEPLPFVYRITPTENFDPGGTIWEFLVQHDEGLQEVEAHHPARQWVNGRHYLVQGATQKAALRQLERHVPESAGFRITLLRNHETGFAKAG
jgi:cell division protein FtsX